MWKISRNIIFPRWHASKQTPVETKPSKPVPPKAFVSCSFEKKSYSDESYGEKEKFHKESKRFWSCNNFQYLLRPMFFETAGWLGAVTVLCFKFHTKYLSSHSKNDCQKLRCIFSRNVLAMPEDVSGKNTLENKVHTSDNPPLAEINKPNGNASPSSGQHMLEDLQTNAGCYIAAIQNSTGVSSLDKNGKKAFRHFQAAARLGSSQGLYNLGLCYELGKGTKVNLNRAAFCYRKAAMKGHGLASFNLAIFFFKGLGGLPVDTETAELLLAEAADKGVPEAKVFMGIQCLEEEKWSDAFQVFNNLATMNVLDGKYYLGLCYANGWGVKKDVNIATEIFSQAAALGHSKSILSLSNCYEEGFGNCEQDLDFAEALCQILVDQNDDEGKKALQRLKVKKEEMHIKDLLKLKLSALKPRNPSIHVSSSVPEIPSNKLLKPNHHSFTFSYSDLISSTPHRESLSCNGHKPSFFIGDEKLNLSLPTTYIPVYSNGLHMMVAKT